MSNLQIVNTPDGRALEYDGQQIMLPALPVDAVVHAYATPGGLWAGVQEPGAPRPVYPGSGGERIGTIGLEADEQAAAEALRQASIPQSVTPRQARLALLQAGLLSQVDDALASLDAPEREAAQIEWEYATTIERGSAWIANLGAALGLSELDIDELFVTASGL